MSPERGRVGSEVIITGKNFPVANDDGSDIEVDRGCTTPTARWTTMTWSPTAWATGPSSSKCPRTPASRPTTPSPSSSWTMNGATVTESRTHRVPQGTVAFGAASGAEGSLLIHHRRGLRPLHQR